MEQGIRKQFEEAFRDNADAIFRYCYFRLNDRERAKELTQEVFMKSWEYVIKGGVITNLRAFIFRTAHNLVVNEYRDKKNESSLDRMSEDAGFDPPFEGAGADEEADVRLAVGLLGKLDPAYRDVMVMRYVEGMAVKEIAEVVGESESAISVRIHRSLKKLKSMIETKSNG